MTSFCPLRQLPLALAIALTVAASFALAQVTPASGATASATAKVENAHPAQQPAQPKAADQPFIHSIHEVELGMTGDDARKKLGKPEVADDTGMYFNLAGGDSVQIGLDENKKVRTVALMYAAGSKSAPSLKDIFGSGVEDVTGDTYKMERYAAAGYWVSYSRTNSSDKPLVIVTIRKMN